MFPNTSGMQYEDKVQVHIEAAKTAMDKDLSGWAIGVNIAFALIYAVLAIVDVIADLIRVLERFKDGTYQGP